MTDYSDRRYVIVNPGRLPEETRRIAAGRISLAIDHLGATGTERHQGIHEARKRFKEIRALLRLIREPLGSAYHGENEWYRNRARALAGPRDAQAMVEAVEKLRETMPTSRRLLNDLRRTLRRRRDLIAGDAASAETALIRDELESARGRINDWPLAERGFDLLAPGLQQSYRRGRQRLRDAYRHPHETAFHEWRKRVKDHWYHVQLLGAVWPQPMKARQKSVKQLSDALGDDHDLAVLRALLIRDDEIDLGEASTQELLGLMGQRQAELRRQASRQGRRIYAERAGRLTERFAVYWRAWSEEQE